MTHMRDLKICEGAAVACSNRRHDLCFVPFLLEQISAPALGTCARMLREGSDHGKTILLQALLDIHQSKILCADTQYTSWQWT